MNVYYLNNKATAFTEHSPLEAGSSVYNVYDPMLELRADFLDASVTLRGGFDDVVAIDSFCLGYTNACSYRLETRECVFEGRIAAKGQITVHDFDETVFTDYFVLELEGEPYSGPLYLGHIYLGQRTALPRFAVGPETGLALNSEASRSFGGQVSGIKRAALESFSVNYSRLASEERSLIKEYVKAVQNVEPHIIDPYPQARDEFPPVYAALDMEGVSMTKLKEKGFYYTGRAHT